MTEIPEHLLRRSKERRAALSGEGTATEEAAAVTTETPRAAAPVRASAPPATQTGGGGAPAGGPDNGFANFFGPLVGAFAFIFLKSELMGATQYWRFFLGVTLVLIVVLFPRGLMGVGMDLWSKLRRK